MNDKSRDCLVKILLECDRISERCHRFAIDKKRFVDDAAYADMLLMLLAQIGEMSAHIGDDVLKDIMPLAVWRQVRGFRDIIVHSYGSIDRVWAWDTVERDIPELRSKILQNDEVRAAYDREIVLIREAGESSLATE